jgi:hypothetical protein
MSKQALQRLFASKRVDTTSPGFYDLPAFRAVEEQRPNFLEAYAEWIEVQSYDNDYLARVRQVVPNLVTHLYNEVAGAKRSGACVDVSGALVRMLEEEKIWAVAVGGGLTIDFPAASGLSPSYFGVIAKTAITAAHMWVHVPPFRVVDVTLPMQFWKPNRQIYFTRPVVAEVSTLVAASIYDLADLDVIGEFEMMHGREPRMRDIELIIPHAFPFMKKFPAFQVTHDELTIKYVPTKIGATEDSLYNLIEPRLNGRSPGDIYKAYQLTM